MTRGPWVQGGKGKRWTSSTHKGSKFAQIPESARRRLATAPLLSPAIWLDGCESAKTDFGLAQRVETKSNVETLSDNSRLSAVITPVQLGCSGTQEHSCHKTTATHFNPNSKRCGQQTNLTATRRKKDKGGHVATANPLKYPRHLSLRRGFQ